MDDSHRQMAPSFSRGRCYSDCRYLHNNPSKSREEEKGPMILKDSVVDWSITFGQGLCFKLVRSYPINAAVIEKSYTLRIA